MPSFQQLHRGNLSWLTYFAKRAYRVYLRGTNALLHQDEASLFIEDEGSWLEEDNLQSLVLYLALSLRPAVCSRATKLAGLALADGRPLVGGRVAALSEIHAPARHLDAYIGSPAAPVGGPERGLACGVGVERLRPGRAISSWPSTTTFPLLASSHTQPSGTGRSSYVVEDGPRLPCVSPAHGPGTRRRTSGKDRWC